jgi:hypothetical protein
MTRSGESLRRTDEEIRGEKAAALGRAGERLAEALQVVETLATQLDAVTDPRVRDELAAAYEAARQRASRARLMLVIQREAVGLRRHAVVDQQFPEPPRRPRSPDRSA